ncbi:ADP-ribosyltransferase [Methanimicrococcus blatticola]|uniref:ADP-ribosyltransferase exoenzyme n=1 Tax=Methanimicrococcus blatticola TaxID=91560 RepID=A0A484F3J4_9EURY|nr:ADP-ribosyltransferase [Methanimicrococcus blatticola]MBZ3935675.1 hypothetical protein [Methanimicrococcus blatticola]MCC2508204.1 ADP-ribosyltransferase [Methanimicrococcus blatticola]TDQ68718.1 ADP-ribosyltransferase exoenzyme [Methanimicrococcus blatticola]
MTESGFLYPNLFYDSFPNYIAEESAEYIVLKSCYSRNDLTDEEKISIGHYQDIHSYNIQKNNWSIEIPPNWKNKSYCYIMNSCCRYDGFLESLGDCDQKLVCTDISNIDSAISKSRFPSFGFAFRGLDNLNWLPFDLSTQSPVQSSSKLSFTENAYGSFSLRAENALSYTNPDHPILLQLYLTPEMPALFIDNAEYEILRPRGISYIFSKCKFGKWK